MLFSQWIDTFLEEKEIDQDQMVEVKGRSGMNIMPLSAIIKTAKGCPADEKRDIKRILVEIDFKNGDVMHFFRHISQAVAL